MDNALLEGNEEDDDNTILYLPGNKPSGRTLLTESDDKPVLHLPGIKQMIHLHKELRVFLEEEQKASETGPYLNEDQKQEIKEEYMKAIVASKDEDSYEDKSRKMEVEEGGKIIDIQLSFPHETEMEEDEESRKQRGKGNVEKWLQMLLENTTQEGTDLIPPKSDENETIRKDEIIDKMNLKYQDNEKKTARYPEIRGAGRVYEEKNNKPVQKKDRRWRKEDENTGEKDSRRIGSSKDRKKVGGKVEGRFVESKTHITPFKNPPYILHTVKSEVKEERSSGKVERSHSCERKERRDRGLMRSESARAFRGIPSSPSMILGMRKGVDCIRKKKPLVVDDNGSNEDREVRNNFLKSSFKTIKRAVKM